MPIKKIIISWEEEKRESVEIFIKRCENSLPTSLLITLPSNEKREIPTLDENAILSILTEHEGSKQYRVFVVRDLTRLILLDEEKCIPFLKELFKEIKEEKIEKEQKSCFLI